MKTPFIATALVALAFAAAPLTSEAQTQQTQQQRTQQEQQRGTQQEQQRTQQQRTQQGTQQQGMQSESKDKDKKQIEKDRLPQTIQTSISGDQNMRSMNVDEAWEVTKEDGSKYYVVKMDKGGEKVEKKFNANGTEIKDKDGDKKRKDD